jgi:hypothetical protein
LFCDERYISLKFKNKHVWDLIPAYINKGIRLMQVEKENEELKEKMKTLELQIRYMPDGEGYEEAKDSFECLSEIYLQNKYI